MNYASFVSHVLLFWQHILVIAFDDKIVLAISFLRARDAFNQKTVWRGRSLSSAQSSHHCESRDISLFSFSFFFVTKKETNIETTGGRAVRVIRHKMIYRSIPILEREFFFFCIWMKWSTNQGGSRLYKKILDRYLFFCFFPCWVWYSIWWWSSMRERWHHDLKAVSPGAHFLLYERHCPWY